METYDVAVLGGGFRRRVCRIAPGGRRQARGVDRGEAGRRECPYFACMPSKAMLAAAGLRQSIRRAAVRAGAISAPLALDGDREAYAAAVARRDIVAEHRDDSGAVERLRAKGVRVIKQRGGIEGPGVVTAGETRIGWRDLVIAAGTQFREPGIAGLGRASYWTSEDFYSSHELPASAAVIGGGAVGCEIAQVLNRFGCRVTLVQHSPRLLSREEPAVAEALAAALREDGIEVRLAVEISRVEPVRGGARVVLDDGWSAAVERVIVAIGMRANADRIGLERLGVELDARGYLPVDDRCRVAGRLDLWGAGDVTSHPLLKIF